MRPGKSSKRRASGRRAHDLCWAIGADDQEIIEALAARRHRGSLREYFGAPALEELSALAAAARKIKRTDAPRVLIVPGMMRSRLGEMRPAAGSMHSTGAEPASGSRQRRSRTLWIDPEAIAAGRLADLKLPAVKPIGALGVVLVSYARLSLTLELAGFDTEFFPYDWRLGVDELGRALGARIAAEPRPVSIVAHSMGGLIARVAVRQLERRRVRRLIMLGTPNRGCFVPLQALRGTHPFVQKIACLDPRASAQRLAAEVFSTFPGLYDLLPPPRGRRGLDLLDPKSWPRGGPQPDAGLLAHAAAARAEMAAPDSRMAHIIGVNRETVVAVRRTAAGFEYASSLNGDGTVPAALAALPGLKSYFVDETHVHLTNNPEIILAVVDLLRRGSTRRLVRRIVPSRRRLPRSDDERLRAQGGGKIDWAELDIPGRAAVFAELDGGRPSK